MGRFCFLRLVTFPTLPNLFFSYGMSGELMEKAGLGDPTVPLKEIAKVSGEDIEGIDYSGRKPNTDHTIGFIFSPPPEA